MMAEKGEEKREEEEGAGRGPGEWTRIQQIQPRRRHQYWTGLNRRG